MADFQPIYAILLLAYSCIFGGLWRKDFAITILGSFLSILCGIYIIPSGLDTLNNYLTQAFGIICIGIGSYVGIRSGLDIINLN